MDDTFSTPDYFANQPAITNEDDYNQIFDNRDAQSILTELLGSDKENQLQFIQYIEQLRYRAIWSTQAVTSYGATAAATSEAIAQNKFYVKRFSDDSIRHSTLQSEVITLQKELLGARQQLTEAQATGKITVTTATSKSSKWPDAPMFNGDRDKFYPWIQQIKTKLENNHDYYPSDHSKIQYIHTRTEGKAASICLPYVSGHDLEAFMTRLEVSFGNPDRERDARRGLEQLRQTNKPFTDHLARFQELSAYANLDDATLHYLLVNSISQELATFLITAPVPASPDLQGAISHLQGVSSRWAATQNRAPTNKNTLNQRLFAANQRTASTPNVTYAAPAAAPFRGLTTSQGGSRMDLSQLDANKKLLPSIRADRTAKGLCLYCGNHPALAGGVVQRCEALEARNARSLQRGTQPAAPSNYTGLANVEAVEESENA